MSSPLNYGTPSSRLGVATPRTPGAVGTPIRPRPDVRSERKMRTVNLGAGGGSEPVCEVCRDRYVNDYQFNKFLLG